MKARTSKIKRHTKETRISIRLNLDGKGHSKIKTGIQPPAASWGALDRDAAFAGLADSIRSLAAFTRADAITLGKVIPSAFKPPIARHLKGDRS